MKLPLDDIWKKQLLRLMEAVRAQSWSRRLQTTIVMVCVALFGVGIVWNLFAGMLLLEEESLEAMQKIPGEPVEATTELWEEAFTTAMAQRETERRDQPQEQRATILAEGATQQEADRQIENHLAALRMKRQRDWQQLMNHLETLEQQERLQCQQSYAKLQHEEQRLELLLEAKGAGNSLVLLSEGQANILVEPELLDQAYLKIFDLVERNTTYPPQNIVLIPLMAEQQEAGA